MSVNRNRQQSTNYNTYQQTPQLIQFEDNPSSIYYQYAPPSIKSQIKSQLQKSYYSNRNAQGQHDIPLRKLSGYEHDITSSLYLDQSQGYNSLVRSRKFTDDNIQYKGTRTPRTSGSAFNMSKFLSNYKQKVQKTPSRKNSSNQKIDDQHQYNYLGLSQLKKLGSIEQKQIEQLPNISKISIQFIDNWGDSNFIGAKAVQFFTDQGKVIQPTVIIPEVPNSYNLINGNIFTKCDQQFWLSPLNKNNSINFIFNQRFTLSMIRVWNYNKSCYTERGVKNIRILGDNSIIFFGQIKKAYGTIINYSETAEYILFTSSNTILNKIITNDWLSNYSFENLHQISQDHQASLYPETAIIYPLHNIYNCYSLITVQIIQNYGDPGYSAYQKLRFYNNSGNLIKYKNKSNKDKVMTNPPPLIQFSIIQPSIVEKIVVKNSQNEAAIKKIKISFDTGVVYIIDLGYVNVDQVFLLNSSIKYDFAHFQVKNTPLQNTVRFGKQIKIILHKNYGANQISFNKLQIFDVYNTPMLSSRQIPYYVSENMRYLETSTFSNWKTTQADNFHQQFNEEHPVQLVIKFQSVIMFGAVILWNTKGKRQQSVKQMQIRIDDKVTYHGYVDHYAEESKPQTVLLSFKQNVYQCFKDYLGERKVKQLVNFNNEGMLFLSQK